MLNSQTQTHTVLIFACVISSISLFLSMYILITQPSSLETLDDGSYDLEELGARLEDLEEEHDYFLDEEITSEIQNMKKFSPRPQFCSLLPDPGPCGSQVERWYFLPKQDDCVQFPWGGCHGNENNFVSLHQCRAACQPFKVKDPSTQISASPLQIRSTYSEEKIKTDDCRLPPDSGPCEDRITRFYHDGYGCKM